jgi:iron complex transport system substrate-binding protein
MRALKATTVLLLALSLVASAGAAVAGQAASPIAVQDSLGRRVVVPAEPRRIISLEPEVTRIIVALGAGERLVGIDFFLRNYDHLFPLVFPEAGRLPVLSNQGQELNYEAAVGLRPDIVFVSPSESGTAEAVEKKLRVPVAALASMGRLQDLLAEIGSLGRMLGREDRAAFLVKYARDKLDSVRFSAAGEPVDALPSVYLAFWGSLVRTPVFYEPVEAAGGRNAASGLLPAFLGAPGATVSVEQILVWDPEVILVQGNYPPAERQVTVEGILKDPRLASVRAVRTGRVSYTFGYWYWWDPALVLVETIYLSRLLRPGSGPAFDLVREGNTIFREFYGVEGAFEALCRILKCHEWTTR